MKRIRIKKEIALVWAVTTNGHEEPLAGRNLSLFLVDPKYRKTAKTFHIENGNEVHFRVYPSEQPFTGVYTLELWENLGGQDQTVVDKRSAFELVNFTPQECDGSVDDIHAAEVFIGSGNLAVGIHGRGIVSVTKVSEDPNDWDYRILYDDGATEIIQIARGEKGLTDEEHAELIAETLAAKSAAQSANAAAANASQKAAEAAEAAQTANDAAEAANAAKEAADAATEAAQEATAAANAAKTAANNAATLANNAAANANTKAALAQAAADATNAAIAAASTATAAANAATAAANTAAEAANTAASTANSAASNASAKATLANNAATAANAAKDAANSAASAANAAAALANDAAARAEAAILTIENKIERVELVCEDDQHITRKGSSVALTYDEVKALVDEPKNFVTLRYLDMFWMLPSYDDGGAIMFTSSGIEFGHVVVTRVILNTDGQMNNYSIIAEDSDHKTNDMSKETAMDGHLTYPTTRAVNGEVNGLGNIIARSITSTPTEQTIASRVTAGGAAIGDGVAYISRVKGRTLKVVQLVNLTETTRSNNGVTLEPIGGGTFKISGTASGAASTILITNGYPRVKNGNKYLWFAKGAGLLSWGDHAFTDYNGALTLNAVGSKAILTAKKDSNVDIRTVVFVDKSWNETITPMLFDLTEMFGAGKEPDTPQAFAEALGYPSIYAVPFFGYTEGRLIPSHVEGLKSIGHNVWDEEWERGIWDVSTGVSGGGNQIRCKNFIRVTPNESYFFKTNGNYCWVLEYDENKNYLHIYTTKRDGVLLVSASTHFVKFYMLEAYGLQYKYDIIVARSNTSVPYEPYTESIRKWSGIMAQHFPDGMKSLPIGFDSFTSKRTEKIVGWVDMGTLNWVKEQIGPSYRFEATVPKMKKPSTFEERLNLVCSKYEANSSPISYNPTAISGVSLYNGSVNVYAFDKDKVGMSTEEFKASMQGVILYFTLAEPIVTDIPELPMWYEAFNGGTEEAITAEESAPLVADIGYNENPATALNLL